MIVSINQPAHLPWLGYFQRIAAADAHIVLDHVQFEKNSFTNRNKVRLSEGWCWLTVPVRTAGKFGDLSIYELEIASERPWASKHWETLRLNYSHAPFFDQHSGFFRDVYSRTWLKLADLMREVTGYLLEVFSIRTTLYFSSQMKGRGKKDELVLNLCRELGATVYLSGPQGRKYLREELFGEHNIAVRYHDYHHPVYSQVYPGFEPFMAAIDLLFNAGPASREILLKDQQRVAL